jgi:hypothetical protein
MSLSTLPQPIKAFLQRAVLIDMGEEHRGDEIARRTDSLYLGSNARVHPPHTEERDGRTVLTVAVDGDYTALGMTGTSISPAIASRGARLRMIEGRTRGKTVFTR